MKTNFTTNKIRLNTKTVIVLLMTLLASPIFAKTKDSALQDRLEKLSLKLEKKREQFHIPGMAIAIVKEDKVIFSKGFGVSELEKKTPVSSKTVFGIGSITKAFTATLVGQLVDEGFMRWDDPVTKYLPYLQFKMRNMKTIKKDKELRVPFKITVENKFNGKTTIELQTVEANLDFEADLDLLYESKILENLKNSNNGEKHVK